MAAVHQTKFMRAISGVALGCLLSSGITARAELQPVRIIARDGDSAAGFPEGTVRNCTMDWTYLSESGRVVGGDSCYLTPITQNPPIYGGLWYWNPTPSETLLAGDELQVSGLPEGTFTSFPRGPLIDRQGRIAYLSSFVIDGPVTNEDSEAMFFVSPPGLPQVFLRTGSPAPHVADATISAIPGYFGISPSSGLAVVTCEITQPTPGTSYGAIYAGTVGNLRLVAKVGDILPGGGTIQSIIGQAINDSGQVGFLCSLDTIDSTGINVNALCVGNPDGSINVAIKTGDPIPTLDPGINVWLITDPPRIDNSGRVSATVFTTDMTVEPSERKACLYGLPGNMQTIAYTNQQAPGMDVGVQFKNLGELYITPDGSRIGFNCLIKGPGVFNTAPDLNDTVFYAGVIGDLRPIARLKDQAADLPPGNIYEGLHNFKLTDSGRVVFRGSFSGPDTPLILGNLHPMGVYASDSTGKIHLVARSTVPIEIAPGDVRDPAYVTTAYDGPSGTQSNGANAINSQGKLLISGEFFDASTALMVFQIPEPCPADFDQNGSVSVADIFAFLNAWFSQFNVCAGSCTADINNSGSVEVADIFAFLNAWFASFGVGCN